MTTSFVVPILCCALFVSVSTLTAGFNCSRSAQCKKELDRLRIEEIKSIILMQLGMTEPPTNLPLNITNDMRAEFEEMAEKMEAEEDVKFRRKSATGQLYPGRDPSDGEDGSELITVFDMPSNFLTDELIHAKLLFYVNLPEGHPNEDVYVQVYEKKEGMGLGELAASKKVQFTGNEILSIELPVETVKAWFEDEPIAGVFVSATVGGQNIAIHPQQSRSQIMYLRLTTIPRNIRTRRSAVPTCDWTNPSLGCCLYDLLIDFRRIGWDWVIAPQRYNAYVCRGDCKYNRHHFALGETGHTKVMGVVDRMNLPSRYNLDKVGYCCYPSDYEFMKMIYINREGRIAQANIHGMMARRCVCG